MIDLASVLKRIRVGIRRNAYPSEAAVQNQIVPPVLQALGWDVFDPEKVVPEYQLRLKTGAAPRRIDLALCVSDRNPRCIVELKSTRVDLREIGHSAGDRQLFEYAFHAGAPLALLTNGVNWRFYSTQSAGTYAERLVKDLDLESDPLEQIASNLERYLSWKNTASGRAADLAREDLNARLDRRKARATIPRAWARLVEGKVDARLSALLTEATVSLTGSAPAESDIARFLSSLTSEEDRPRRRTASRRRPKRQPDARRGGPEEIREPAWTPGTETRTQRPESSDHGTKSGAGPSSERPGRSGRPAQAVRYWLLGKEYVGGNAKDAYIAVFGALAERDPEFLTRVEPRLRGRTRRGLSQAKHELSGVSSVLKVSARLPGGWWLDTNLSNAQKTRRLKIACEIAGIPFGDRAGLDILLPTRSRRSPRRESSSED